jgi:hypothetical protein
MAHADRLAALARKDECADGRLPIFAFDGTRCRLFCVVGDLSGATAARNMSPLHGDPMLQHKVDWIRMARLGAVEGAAAC